MSGDGLSNTGSRGVSDAPGVAGKRFLGRSLMLRKEFGDMILRGVKTSTIRLGYIVPKSRELIIHSGGRPIARVEIEDVLYKRLDQLGDEDARREGYESVSKLVRELRRIYGKRLYRHDVLTIIRFRVLERLDDRVPEKPYMGLDIRDIARLSLNHLSNELDDLEKRVLNMIAGGDSIRRVSQKLFGGIERRYIVRRILKRCLDKLVSRGIVKASREAEGRGSDIKMPSPQSNTEAKSFHRREPCSQ